MNVLKVANAALRYKPSDEVLTQLGAAATPGDATTTPREPHRRNRGRRRRDARAQGRGQRTRKRPASGRCTPSTADGKLQVARVRTGISDGVVDRGPGDRT